MNKLLNNKYINKILKSEKWILFVLYTMSHFGLVFLLNAKFWDDWTLWNTEIEVIRSQFKQNGIILAGELHVFLRPFSPWIYKILTFILWFFSGMLLYKIARNSSLIKNKQHAFYLSLLFLITPYFSARVSIINFPYLVCLFLFLLAWSISNKHKTLSLILFFLSFNTQSLLMFYALPFVDNFHKFYNVNKFKGVLKWSINNSLFIILPFVFFAIKNIYFPPNGAYEDYNQIFSIKTLFYNLPKLMVDYCYLTINVLLFLIISIISWVFIKNREAESNNNLYYLILGFISLFLGAFPYMIVGHIPTFDDWNSRHQLLLPIGLSLLLLGVTGFLKLTFKFNLMLIVVPLFITLNIQSYVAYFDDWQKQKRIIEKIKYEHPEIANINLLLIDDHTLNAKNRQLRFYEWNGILKLANGHSKVFAININEYQSFLNGDYNRFIDNKDYNSEGFKNNSNIIIKTLEIRKQGKYYNTVLKDFTNDSIK